MKAVKTVLLRLLFCYMLLAALVIPSVCMIPNTFPTRNFSTVTLAALSICLILYYSHRVLSSGLLSVMIRMISWNAFLMIVLRGLKYSVFAGVGILARHMWYFYYIPLLTLPLLLFYVSLLVSPKDAPCFSRKWYPAAFITGIFIFIVLTNDLHQKVFAFKPGFENWDGDYTRGWLFYAITAWEYLLYFAAVLILVKKCRIGKSRKYGWLTLIPFSIGIIMSVMLFTGIMPKISGTYVIGFPETVIIMVAGVIEVCMTLGFIPTNSGYGNIFQNLSLPAQITDRRGRALYRSRLAKYLTADQFSAPDGARIGEHTVLRRMEIPGGYAFWQVDMSELDRLNEALEEAKDRLSQETELKRLQGELKEKQTKIEQRTKVYDDIARRVREQSQAISDLAAKAGSSRDGRLREECRARIVLLGAFIKRFANLMLLSYENSTLRTGELALSFSEVLRYLNLAGIPGEMNIAADTEVPATSVLAIFETFGALCLNDLDDLKGVLINISLKDKAVCKLTLERLVSEIPKDISKTLSDANVSTELVVEDGVTYISLTVPDCPDPGKEAAV